MCENHYIRKIMTGKCAAASTSFVVVADADAHLMFVFLSACSVVFWLLNGILEWIAFVVQYGFPLFNFMCLGLFPYCLENVYALFDDEGFTRCNCQLLGNDVPEACVDYLFTGFTNMFGNEEGGYDCTAVQELYREFDYDLAAVYGTIAGGNPAAFTCIEENQ